MIDHTSLHIGGLSLTKHDTFLLRIDPAILRGVKQWAADELRSANGQIEFILRDALQKNNRLAMRSPDEPSQNGHAETSTSSRAEGDNRSYGDGKPNGAAGNPSVDSKLADGKTNSMHAGESRIPESRVSSDSRPRTEGRILNDNATNVAPGGSLSAERL